jgi:hypothetical protein
MDGRALLPVNRFIGTATTELPNGFCLLSFLLITTERIKRGADGLSFFVVKERLEIKISKQKLLINNRGGSGQSKDLRTSQLHP